MSSVLALAGRGTPELLIIVVVLGLLLAVFAGVTSAVVWPRSTPLPRVVRSSANHKEY